MVVGIQPMIIRKLLPAAGLAVLVYLLALSGSLNFLDRLLTDARMQTGASVATGHVVIVGIDAESLRQLDQWPWPRRYHADLIDRLLDAGASRIGIDIDFSSKSNQEDDRALEAALSEAGSSKIALPVFRQHQPTADGRTSVVETRPQQNFRRHVTETMANVIPDPDGLVRWLEPTGQQAHGTMPTLAGWLAGNSSLQPIEARQLVDFGIDVGTIPYYSYHEVLAGRLAPGTLDGRLVLVGAVDVSLGDYVTVPHYRALPGVAFHALAAESLLQGRLIRSPSAWWINVLAAVGTFLFWCVLAAFGPPRQIIVGTVVISGFGISTLILQAMFGLAVPSADLLAGMMLTSLAKVLEHLHHLAKQKREAAAMAAQRHALFVRVVEASLDGIVVFDEHARILSGNTVAGRFFRMPPEQLVDRQLNEVLPDVEPPLLEAFAKGSVFETERHLIIQNDIRVATQIKFTPVDGEGVGKVGILTLQDVSERKTQTDALIHMATHDALTGLANRTMFLNRLIEASDRGRETSEFFAVILIDLDQFKEVNDTLGHSIGDRLLQELARRIVRVLDRDHFAARLGGDEFALRMNSSDGLDGIVAFVQHLLEKLREPFLLLDYTLQIDASIGIASFPEHAQEAETLTQCADIAMYNAKRARTGFAIYDATADTNSRRRLTLMADVRQGIKKEQLRLLYQPKAWLQDLRLAGVEALLRWEHPRFGSISPTEFVPMAEETGCINELTLAILEIAIDQYQTWQALRHDIPIAINLSSRSLRHRSFVDMLVGILSASRIAKSAISFELTESISIHEDPETLANLTLLHKLGFEIALDDFGTGYSSFAYLHQLPIDTLKIDRAFLQAPRNDGLSEDVMRGIIDLGHKLGLKTIAEGVENAETLAWLSEIGCDIAQGFYLGRPMSAETIPSWPHATPYFESAPIPEITSSRLHNQSVGLMFQTSS